MNAFILAGGQSTRMGRDKALLDWGDTPLVLRAVEMLRNLGLPPRICGSRSDLARFAPVVSDRFTRAGPLAGIEAGLAVSDAELNLFLPVDMPDIPAAFLRWMLMRAETSEAVATIPCYGGRPQPLCAVYHRRMADGLRAALEEGNRKVMAAVTGAAASLKERVDLFQVESVASAVTSGLWPFQPPLRYWFRNLNTPADVEAATRPASGANQRDPIS